LWDIWKKKLRPGKGKKRESLWEGKEKKKTKLRGREYINPHTLKEEGGGSREP